MNDAFVQDMITNLRYHMAWIAICENYLRAQPKSDVTAFLQAFQAAEQEAIEIIAYELRQRGVSPARLGAHENLITDGLNRHTTRSRVQFIVIGLDRSMVWYEERLAGGDAESTAFWQTLFDLLAPQAAAAKALIEHLETPQKTG
ncbi:MAG: hypothetical protein J5I90_09665 [Caldilineales bacterium]|nr:hypothetical protein [Caldilineales bacterium]